jgi:hypothetical protein
MLDDTLTLDIPDELPAHLAGGEEAHLTQLSQGAEFSMGSVRTNRGKNAAINLPSQSLASTADSISDAMEDMSDLLHPGSPLPATAVTISDVQSVFLNV